MESFAYLQRLRDSEETLNKIKADLEYLYLDSALTDDEVFQISEIMKFALSRNLYGQSEFYKKLKKQL